VTEAIQQRPHDLSIDDETWSSESNGHIDLPLAQRRKHHASSDDRRIRLVLVLLEEDPHRQWRLDDLAAIVNLSLGRLAHLFKSEMDISVQQYLTQLRLEHATHKLEMSFLSIKEIAAAVGFPNVSRFTASFKAAVGVTPREYRKGVVSNRTARKIRC
jgi:AraC-like DNA-binding protein